MDRGIKGDEVSKFWVFGHFLGNQSLKVSNFLHDGRRQQGTPPEYGGILWKNPDPRLIWGLELEIQHSFCSF